MWNTYDIRVHCKCTEAECEENHRFRAEEPEKANYNEFFNTLLSNEIELVLIKEYFAKFSL
jgi:hypothetical protein